MFNMKRALIFACILIGGVTLVIYLKLSNIEEQDYLLSINFNAPLDSDIPIMEDRNLISFLREKFLLPPPVNKPLNLSSPWLVDTSMGQSAKIREVLGEMRNGFFVECGALDGETRSNTLVFERLFNWSGLLIEADPLNFESAVWKRRNVYLSNTCVSIKPYSMVVSFHQHQNLGKIDEEPFWLRSGSDHVDVQCFPLYSYLLALNRTTVDYFSLDVEGHELEVLQTIPWDRVNIRTLSVEYIHGKRSKEILRAYMEKVGYHVYAEVAHFRNLANDYIFVKNNTVS